MNCWSSWREIQPPKPLVHVASTDEPVAILVWTWINFIEFKTVPQTVLLELNGTSTSSLPFETYNDYLLSHRLYVKFFSSLSVLSEVFVQPTFRLSYNNTTRNEAYADPRIYSLLSLLWTLRHRVNVPFLSLHLYYGTVYRILLKIQHLIHLSNLPQKHSCFGNFTFDVFYKELYLAFMSPKF